MMSHLTIISTEKLNDFPVNGTLDNYRPNQKMGHKTYEGTGDYLCEFGRRVGIKNNICAPTCEAIYLKRNYDIQDEYLVMGLVTGKEAVIEHVNPIPMTKKIKDRVEQLAREENVGDLEIITREFAPPTGTIQYQNVGVYRGEVDDDEVDNDDIAEVSNQLPRPIRMECRT